MLQYLEHLCEDELKGYDKISLNKKQLREELDKCLADNVRIRAANKQADKLLNQKVKQQRQEEDVSLPDTTLLVYINGWLGGSVV